MDIIDEPRVVLKAAGGRINEMEKSGYDEFLLRRRRRPDPGRGEAGDRISAARVRMAQETGAPLLVSNCPFCLTMFEDGIKTGAAKKN